jgi:hypothetical protein
MAGNAMGRPATSTFTAAHGRLRASTTAKPNAD